jgi:hypothetical protein
MRIYLCVNALTQSVPVEHTRAGLANFTARVGRATTDHDLRDLIVAIERTGDDHLPVKRAAVAVGAVELFEGLPAPDDAQWFGLACARATLSAAAESGGPGPSVAEASGLADRAIDDLRRAAAMGHRSPAQYHYESALGPLRSRADSRALIRDLAFPADPFAR